MPQHKLMKKAAPRFSKKKQTTSRLLKVNSRKARKDGMVMKRKNVTDAQKIKSRLQAEMGKNIENELSSRAGASSTCNLKIIKPPAETDGKK